MDSEPGSTPSRMDVLLQRLHTGDPGAVPEIVIVCAPMILGRIRDGVRSVGRAGNGLRSVIDADDLMSEIAMRLHAAAQEHRIRADSGGELFAYVRELSTRTIHEKIRWFRQLRRLGTEAQRRGRSHIMPERDDEMDQRIRIAIAMLPSEQHRTLARLRLTGFSHLVIADQLSISRESARQMWRAVRLRLIEFLGEP